MAAVSAPCWIYLAPVCGTASRARDIRVFAGDPQPLRSNSEPEGLSNLQPEDARRVSIANALFEYACKLFHIAYSRGILATMENPRTSYFWLMLWVLQLMLAWDLFCGDFQECMAGGTRDKWTRIAGNFPGVLSLNIRRNRQHCMHHGALHMTVTANKFGKLHWIQVSKENVHSLGDFSLGPCLTARPKTEGNLFA